MSKKYLFGALLLLSLMAAPVFAEGGPLQQAAGRWLVNADETFAASDSLRELVQSDPQVEQKLRESFKDAVMVVDIERMVLIDNADSPEPHEAKFTVISESAPEGKLVLQCDGDRIIIEVNGDRLVKYGEDDGSGLRLLPTVFDRLP